MTSKVISFRITEGEFAYLMKVHSQVIEDSFAAGHDVTGRVLKEMSVNTFAKIVFDHGLDHILEDNRSDLNRGGTTTSPMGDK